jgi:hypothetical protein
MQDDSVIEQPRMAEPLKLRQMLWAFTTSQAVSAAAKLAIVDVLADGPKSPDEISNRTCPQAQGVLFELPGVVATADAFRQSAVAPRCEILSGNMFDSVPEGGDVYLLKAILHDWSDDDAVQILRNCRTAITDSGRLLVLEAVNAPPGQADFAKLVDLMMLVLLTGRERTEEDFRDLFAIAGFRLTRLIPTGMTRSSKECRFNNG